MIIQDMILNNRTQNIYEKIYDEILSLCKKYEVTLSIGTTYRPATIGEALDKVQLLELERQTKFVELAIAKNVKIMMEGIGHITINDLLKYKEHIDKIGVNLMPLGPIITDSAIGFDHVASAIGAAFSSFFGMSNIINVVTRDEHTGGIPDINSIIEGLKSARVAAHAVNLSRFDKLQHEEYNLSKLRATKKSCILSGGLFDYISNNTGAGCGRCGQHCPLL